MAQQGKYASEEKRLAEEVAQVEQKNQEHVAQLQLQLRAQTTANDEKIAILRAQMAQIRTTVEGQLLVGCLFQELTRLDPRFPARV